MSGTGEAEDLGDDGMVELVFKWSGDEFPIMVSRDETVGDVKRRLGEITRVLPKRQKIMGLLLAAGKKAAADDTPVSQLLIKPNMKLMMLGSSEEVIDATNRAGEEAPPVVDDFQMQEDVFEALEPANDPDVLAKLERRLKSVDVAVLNAPRPGKKLLVTDIDYTIFDLGSQAETPMELARPHLHAFLTSVYKDYDIVIWSANSMKWMEVKMRGLGVLTHADYRVTFMMDYRAMLTVHTEKYGVFDCKPLPFLWSKFGEHYGPDNTIMLDDLRRNYIMNKQNGLVIRPFRRAHRTRATDRELVRLKYYLRLIAPLESLASLDHSRWERYLRRHLQPDDTAALAADLDNP